MTEWSEGMASGASPKGRGFEPHSCHFAQSWPLPFCVCGPAKTHEWACGGRSKCPRAHPQFRSAVTYRRHYLPGSHYLTAAITYRIGRDEKTVSVGLRLGVLGMAIGVLRTISKAWRCNLKIQLFRKKSQSAPAQDRTHDQKGLRERNSPTCTLRQNGYGDLLGQPGEPPRAALWGCFQRLPARAP